MNAVLIFGAIPEQRRIYPMPFGVNLLNHWAGLKLF
jgi:hypothetical protein